MDTLEFQQRYRTYLTAIEAYLDAISFGTTAGSEGLYASMRYSLLSGGKRLRPVMTLEFARVCGTEEYSRALPFACAVEMMHTYSLIHDDLPCMDNDALRRGKPTNHIVFGETMATLAGDAMQSEAFRVLLSAELPAQHLADAARVLALAAGSDGMVAGQVLDLSEGKKDEPALRLLQQRKTGCMFMAACELGCIAAGADAQMRSSARSYAENLGLAFQIRDDMLDVIGDEATFGKPIGSDREESKTTYVDLLGLDGCAARVRECTDRAVDALRGMGDVSFLRELVLSLAERKK